MTAPGDKGESGTVQKPEERRSPREVLSAFEEQMKGKVKQFDLRVLKNKRRLEKIRGHLNVYLDDCQKALENRLAELDARVDGIADRVDAWEKKLDREQSLSRGAET